MQGCVLHVSAIAIPNGETQKGALGNRQSHTPWSNPLIPARFLVGLMVSISSVTVIGLDPGIVLYSYDLMPGSLGAVHNFDTISEFNNRYKQRMPLPGSLLDGLGRLGNRLQQTSLVRSTVCFFGVLIKSPH